MNLYQTFSYLFRNHDLSSFLLASTDMLSAKVNGIPERTFLKSSVEELTEHIVSLATIEPLAIYEDRMTLEQEECQINVGNDQGRVFHHGGGRVMVPGMRVVVSIPFTGDHESWYRVPSSTISTVPRGVVRPASESEPGYVEMVFEQPADQPPSKIKPVLDREMETIRFYLDAQQTQIETYNAALAGIISGLVETRKDRLASLHTVSDALGIPLKRRDDAPIISDIPIKRKLVRPLPAENEPESAPEPGINDQDYEHILNVIRHESRTFEATAGTYSDFGEEDLRNILLAHLNGHYEGGATGETFRGNGKTDIRIEDKNRAAFVAECKVWRGPKQLSEAIDQLLGYLTWRDCKAAIVIFNKHNAGFSEILKKIPVVLESHDNFVSNVDESQQGEWRIWISNSEDDCRKILIHVFVFDLYVANS